MSIKFPIWLFLSFLVAQLLGQSHKEPYVVVLGIAQDAGLPQAGCHKPCCERVANQPQLWRHAACLAVVDPQTGQRWLLEATPDFTTQLRALDQLQPSKSTPGLAGIFLTHGHMGHYTGLMFLGREVMGSKQVPVYAMRRMHDFLSKNGPWEQLVSLGNISLVPLLEDKEVVLSPKLRLEAFLVPHRDEYTETVGYIISGPNRRVAFIPDTDKWDRWNRPIEALIKQVDVAYLDGTFYSNGELPGRDMSEIPHPFIAESLARFASLPKSERSKVRFIHFNHTNPVLDVHSQASREVHAAGFTIAKEGEIVTL